MVASRVEYGFVEGDLTLVRWHYDGRRESLIEAAVERASERLAPDVRLTADGQAGHAWAEARRSGVP